MSLTASIFTNKIPSFFWDSRSSRWKIQEEEVCKTQLRLGCSYLAPSDAQLVREETLLAVRSHATSYNLEHRVWQDLLLCHADQVSPSSQEVEGVQVAFWTTVQLAMIFKRIQTCWEGHVPTCGELSEVPTCWSQGEDARSRAERCPNLRLCPKGAIHVLGCGRAVRLEFWSG